MTISELAVALTNAICETSDGRDPAAATVAVGTAAGAVFIPMHFGDLDPSDVAQNGGRQVAVNRLTMNYVDPVCYQPIYKHCAVKIAKA